MMETWRVEVMEEMFSCTSGTWVCVYLLATECPEVEQLVSGLWITMVSKLFLTVLLLHLNYPQLILLCDCYGVFFLKVLLLWIWNATEPGALMANGPSRVFEEKDRNSVNVRHLWWLGEVQGLWTELWTFRHQHFRGHVSGPMKLIALI